MDFSLENILFLLFILLPLIQRIFGKKPPAEGEAAGEETGYRTAPAPEPQERPQPSRAESRNTDELDWEKELERLFGAQQAGKADEEIVYQEPAPVPVKPEPVRQKPAPVRAEAPVQFEKPVQESRHQETVRETFHEFRNPLPDFKTEKPARRESESGSFAYHAPESLHALRHTDAHTSRPRPASGIATALKNRKELQRAVILGEILQRRSGPPARG